MKVKAFSWLLASLVGGVFVICLPVGVFSDSRREIGPGAGQNDPSCGSFVGQATPAEIAVTPRERPDLEKLAIRITGAFTADPAVYARVMQDAGIIKWANPGLVTSFRGTNDGKGIFLECDPATIAQIKNNEYHAWDCANAYYGLERKEFFPGTLPGFVFLSFKGTYNTNKLAEEYQKLPGVVRVETNGLAGDGSSLCGEREGDTYHYIVHIGRGDCPAGCLFNEYLYFVSRTPGKPSFVDSYRLKREVDEKFPSWLVQYGGCFPRFAVPVK